MKSDQLRVNSLFFSRRFQNFGMCLATMDFMAYLIFAHGKGQSGWYHCQELERDCYDKNGKIWPKL